MALTAKGGAGRGLRLLLDIDEIRDTVGAAGLSSGLRHYLVVEAELPSGTADGSIDRPYSDSITVTTSPTDLDVLSLVSKLDGSALAMVDFCGVIVKNDGTVGDVIVGGDALGLLIFGGPTHTMPVKPGGFMCWYAPNGITPVNATSDILQLTASTGTIATRVVLLGRSA